MGISLGYQYLIDHYQLEVPALRQTYRVGNSSSHKQIIHGDGSEIFDIPAHKAPKERNLVTGVTFALKHEVLNLTVFASLFRKPASQEALELWLKDKPSSKYARTAAALARWLTDREFNYSLPSGCPRHTLLNAQEYYTGPGFIDTQFSIHLNVLGNALFCPIVQKTPAIQALIEHDIKKSFQEKIQLAEPELLRRAIDYLYLAETQSTYDLEREIPDNNRAAKFRKLLEDTETWAPLTEELFCEWQNMIVQPLSHEFQYRNEQNWLAKPGRLRNIAEYIPPSPNDNRKLMQALIDACQKMMKDEIHPVLIATLFSFGFVLFHPFFDGNGRIHRFLIHHILRRTNFIPAHTILPVSARIIKRIDQYAKVLTSISTPITDLINYRLDADSSSIHIVGGQHIWNYSYPNLTEAFEFILSCCTQSIELDFLEELIFLKAYDQVISEISKIVDLRQNKIDNLIHIIKNNGGFISKAKRHYFPEISDSNMERIEQTIRQAFKIEPQH